MAEDLQSSFPTQFLQQLLGPDSPFLYLRSNSSAKVLQHYLVHLQACTFVISLYHKVLELLLSFFRKLLSIRNIPIVETVYKLVFLIVIIIVMFYWMSTPTLHVLVNCLLKTGCESEDHFYPVLKTGIEFKGVHYATSVCLYIYLQLENLNRKCTCAIFYTSCLAR